MHIANNICVEIGLPVRVELLEIGWLNGVLHRFQQNHSHIMATVHNYSCLSWVSPVLGWGSEVYCSRTLPQKNPEDPVWLEPRTPGLRVKHLPLSHAGPRIIGDKYILV